MTDFCGADDADGPGPNRPTALGRNPRRPWAEPTNGPDAARGPIEPTALGRMGKRPWAETANGPEIKSDIAGPIEATARGPRHLTALGRTGPIEPTALGRTARRPRAVKVIGPVSILNIEMDRAGLHLALGYLPGVLPYGTWRYDPERHALYGGRYFATYEQAAEGLARRRSGRA